MRRNKEVCEAHTYHPYECRGEIKTVIIKQGTATFNLPREGIEYRYCNKAIDKDRQNGFEVIEKETDHV